MKPENYKYHLALRLKGYDYSRPGIYFVNICATNRCDFFGKIDGARSILNDIGQLADSCWKAIPEHFKHASLIDYIVMPDHIHGLIRLYPVKEKVVEDQTGILDQSAIVLYRKGTACRASTGKTFQQEAFGKPTRGSIPTIMRSYKSAVTKAFNIRFPRMATFVWQPGYYEHIIRNRGELEYTINYIRTNPIAEAALGQIM